MDEKTFKYYGFAQDFAEVGLKGFILEEHREIFPTLVRMFYTKLNYIDGVLISEVKKHQIWLTLEEFANISNLIYTDSD